MLPILLLLTLSSNAVELLYKISLNVFIILYTLLSNIVVIHIKKIILYHWRTLPGSFHMIYYLFISPLFTRFFGHINLLNHMLSYNCPKLRSYIIWAKNNSLLVKFCLTYIFIMLLITSSVICLSHVSLSWSQGCEIMSILCVNYYNFKFEVVFEAYQRHMDTSAIIINNFNIHTLLVVLSFINSISIAIATKIAYNKKWDYIIIKFIYNTLISLLSLYVLIMLIKFVIFLLNKFGVYNTIKDFLVKINTGEAGSSNKGKGKSKGSTGSRKRPNRPKGPNNPEGSSSQHVPEREEEEEAEGSASKRSRRSRPADSNERVDYKNSSEYHYGSSDTETEYIGDSYEEKALVKLTTNHYLWREFHIAVSGYGGYSGHKDKAIIREGCDNLAYNGEAVISEDVSPEIRNLHLGILEKLAKGKKPKGPSFSETFLRSRGIVYPGGPSQEEYDKLPKINYHKVIGDEPLPDNLKITDIIRIIRRQ